MAKVIYKINKKIVPSVTTILNRFKNSTGLIVWSNKLGLEGKSYHQELNKAAEIGTNVHELAQQHIEGIDYELPRDETVLNCFYKFIRWWDEYSKDCEVVFCEQSFASRLFQYGGTADLLIKKNNDYIIVDFKTSKSIYSDYVIQGSAYKQMIEEKYDFKINKFIVARFGKESDDFEIKEYSLEKLDYAFEYFKTLRKAFDQDKSLLKIIKE